MTCSTSIIYMNHITYLANREVTLHHFFLKHFSPRNYDIRIYKTKDNYFLDISIKQGAYEESKDELYKSKTFEGLIEVVNLLIKRKIIEKSNPSWLKRFIS